MNDDCNAEELARFSLIQGGRHLPARRGALDLRLKALQRQIAKASREGVAHGELVALVEERQGLVKENEGVKRKLAELQSAGDPTDSEAVTAPKLAMGGVLKDVLREVRERTSIIDVVSRHVTLQKQGRSHVGTCPFCGDGPSSFHVDDGKGLFYCFGCHAGGDVCGFLMRVEGRSLLEVVRELAAEVGIEIEPMLGAVDEPTEGGK